MKLFCEVSTPWQVILLVLSMLTVITITCGIVLSLRNKQKFRKQLGLGAALGLNAAIYVMMQVDSRITGAEHAMHLPYLMVFAVTILFLGFSVWFVLSETKNRKTINHTSIKESFDSLPTGVCFFNEAGLPVLCNRAMHRFSFAVCGKDVQFIADLQDCLSQAFMPLEGVEKTGKIFSFSDGSAWQLETHKITHENGEVYTQYIALDVTQLQRNRVELMEENAQHRKVQADLKQLSANVVAVTREEEILNTKMRVHDEMGKCLLAAQQYLKDDTGQPIPDAVIASWKRAVSMMKYNNESRDEDMLLQVRKTCQFVKLEYVQTGQLPRNEQIAYLLTCAVRECVTNAVRYAEATALYVNFTESLDAFGVTITNNGKLPEGEIKEGGGLSTLRQRIEREGGIMQVQARPEFGLTVTIPKHREGAL